MAIGCATFSALADDVAPAAPVKLVDQLHLLPDGFAEHLFGVPLAVRVELDRYPLGEALVVLSKDERVRLIQFTDTADSPVPATVRDTWAAILSGGVEVGTCTLNCQGGLLAVEYSLQNSVLSIFSSNVERSFENTKFHSVPEDGKAGLMVRNQLNLTAAQGQATAGRFGLEAISSLGRWTQTFSAQLARMGYEDDPLYHSITQLHSQVEHGKTFFRLGYFQPDFQGLSRQPSSLGRYPEGTLGIMYGSSEALAIESRTASVFPILVTPNRQAVAEFWRDGVLINSQPVESGLQALDTRALPQGIYGVEVRLIEDGLEVSRSQEQVYKPTNWTDPEQRLRFNTYVGREQDLLSNWENDRSGGMSAGGAINYLLHPRVVGGLSIRQVEEAMQYGTSMDVRLDDAFSFYTSLNQTDGYGASMDTQGLYNYGSGSVVASHSRRWLDNTQERYRLPDGTEVRPRSSFTGMIAQSSLGLSHRLSSRSNATARLAHSNGPQGGYGLDLGWLRETNLFGHRTQWQFSVFDRPGATYQSAGYRSRGAEVSINLALHTEGRRVSARINSRSSGDYADTRSASVSLHQDLSQGPLRSVAATVTTDSHGTGLSGRGQLETAAVNGDFYVQQSTYNRQLSGGLNLDSTLVAGGSGALLTSQYPGQGAGMIIDVESDVADMVLRADDLAGGHALLKPGRNFLPVNAYRQGTVQFDFAGMDAPAANIQPSRAGYNLNKGGVDYQKIRVTKTLTVLGRLVDEQGNALRGLHVLNHASRGVSEADGFFSLEMSESIPDLLVLEGTRELCSVTLDVGSLRQEQDVLMVGDLVCKADGRGVSA